MIDANGIVYFDRVLQSTVATTGSSGIIDCRNFEELLLIVEVFNGTGGTLRFQSAPPKAGATPEVADFANFGAALAVESGSNYKRMRFKVRDLPNPFFRFTWSIATSPGLSAFAALVGPQSVSGALNTLDLDYDPLS